MGCLRRFSRAFAFAAAASAASFVPACAPAPPPAPARPPERRVVRVPPEALAGNWLLAIQMGGRTIEGSLHFSVERGVLAGTWTSSEGREFELSKIALDGDEISWESDGPAGRTHATGKIDGSSMKGSMKRAPRPKESTDSSGSGSSDSGEPGDSGSSGSTRGGGGRGRGMGGRGGRGRSGSSGAVTWTAYKSGVPLETPSPSPPPAATPGPS